jgi:hypothetical protein
LRIITKHYKTDPTLIEINTNKKKRIRKGTRKGNRINLRKNKMKVHLLKENIIGKVSLVQENK